MKTAQRNEILARYAGHARRFDEAAQRRSGNGGAEIIAVPSALLGEPGHGLSTREIEVLRLVSDGLVDVEIANRLFLKKHTVTSHVKEIRAKLGARSRAQAVAIGFRRGLIG